MTATTAVRDDRAFCSEMLPTVSRTFAICFRLLPEELEHPVLVAYLLCRIADTFEDTATIAASERARLLGHFSTCLEEGGPDAAVLRDAFANPRSDEELLVREADAVLREFRRLPAEHRGAIRPWVQEMSSGMAEFVRRQETRRGTELEALTTVEDLEQYCYYVAGTVGHMLTALFKLHHGPKDADRFAHLSALATSFALGLQLTNIIKDVGDDRRRGWSFIPLQLCEVAGIRPEDLQSGRYDDEGRRVMQLLIDKAKRHLHDALDYTVTVPRRHAGIRQFCLTSLYFAVQTLRLAERDERLLDPHHKVKITRRAVFLTVRMTKVVARSNLLVRLYFRWLAGHRWVRTPYAAAPAS